MIEAEARIAAQEEIAPNHFRLVIDFPIGVPVQAGHFFMLRQTGPDDPLLARPLALYRERRDRGKRRLEFVYKVVGRGTDLLSRRAAGERLRALGPLGRGLFGVEDRSARALIVGGGIGIASLYFVAESLVSRLRRRRAAPRAGGGLSERVVVFIGGRTRDDVTCVGDFQSLGLVPRLSSEDGSVGRKGLVTEDFEAWLSARPEFLGAGTRVYACGPYGMLRETARQCEERNISCEVAMEQHMACGFGICLGCAISAKDEKGERCYRLVCMEGPVFDARRVDWR